MTPIECINEHIRLFEENDHYPLIDFKTGSGHFVSVGTRGYVEQLDESELVRLVMLGKVATQHLHKSLTMLSKEEFVVALRNMRFETEPEQKGGLSVKAATQIDALLQSSVNIPIPHDPIAWEVHQFDRLMFGITEDIKQSIRAGKMKRMTEVEREHFYDLLTAFLRHQLKS